jgi:trans-aconitate methyltransferase
MENNIDKDKVTYETWNKLADLYAEKFMNRTNYDETYRRFCDLIPDNPEVLELGCGPGVITRKLLDFCPDCSILATDISPNMILKAQSLIPQVDFEVMDARMINQLTLQFDGIVVGFCIPFFSHEETESFLKSVYHRLNFGGILYLSYVPGSRDQAGYKKGSSGDLTFFNYYENEWIDDVLLKCNFKSIEWYSINFERPDGDEIHRVLLAKK